MGLQLGKQTAAVGENLGQDVAAGGEQIRDGGRAQRVHDLATVAERDDDAGSAQYRELLRQTGRLDVDLVDEVADRPGAGLEQFQHADTHRMSEGPEHLGFRLVQRHRHKKSLTMA